MKARVENRAGNYKYWAGKELGFTRREFIAWAIANPPPSGMDKPSVDRIDSARGYTFDNIRWLDSRVNSRGTQRDIPLTHRRCAICKEVKELNSDNFSSNSGKNIPFQHYCRPCKLGYDRRWRAA
jgi:hypothetical protein